MVEEETFCSIRQNKVHRYKTKGMLFKHRILLTENFRRPNFFFIAGFSFQISDRGGNGPPPKGGYSRGGTPSLRGGNSA